jgi:O-antigen ligase
VTQQQSTLMESGIGTFIASDQQTTLTTPSAAVRPLAAILLGGCILLNAIPLAIPISSLGPIPIYDIAFQATTLVLVTKNIESLRNLREARKGLSQLAWSVILFLSAIAIVTVLHFNVQSPFALLRIVGCCVVTKTTIDLFRRHQAAILIRSICIVIFIQFAVGVAQVVANGPVTAGWVSETEQGFRRIDGVLGPTGSLGFANTLGMACAIMSALLLIALVRHQMSRVLRLSCLLSLGMATALVGLSLSRTALIAQGAVLACAAASKDRRRLAPLLIVLGLCLGGSMAARYDGWVARSVSTVSNSETAGSGRLALNRQAMAVFRLDPIIGVGFGNYYKSINEHPEIASLSSESLMVHNAALYALASTGIVGTAALALLALVLANRALRSGAFAIGTLMVAAPILLLSTQLSTGIGLMWLGMLIGAGLASNKRAQ